MVTKTEIPTRPLNATHPLWISKSAAHEPFLNLWYPKELVSFKCFFLFCYWLNLPIILIQFNALLQISNFDLVSFDLSYVWNKKSQKKNPESAIRFVDHTLHPCPHNSLFYQFEVSFLGFNNEEFIFRNILQFFRNYSSFLLLLQCAWFCLF